MEIVSSEEMDLEQSAATLVTQLDTSPQAKTQNAQEERNIYNIAQDIREEAYEILMTLQVSCNYICVVHYLVSYSHACFG